MRDSLHSIALGAALILLATAFATDASAASRISCARAINSACGVVEPNGGRLQACFESHFDKLSRPPAEAAVSAEKFAFGQTKAMDR